MTSCTIVKEGPRCLHLDIGGKASRLSQESSGAFKRIMELRGWSAQQAFDYLMGTHWDRPWRIVDRMARAMTRKRILFDPALGDLHITRNFVGTLQAYRKKASRSCSSSFTHAPASWSSKFEHVKAGDVHDAEGNFLFTLR